MELFLLYLPVVRSDMAAEPRIRSWITNAASNAGITLLDFTDAFRSRPQSDFHDLHLPVGHYTAAGQRLVAEMLRRELSARLPRIPR